MTKDQAQRWPKKWTSMYYFQIFPRVCHMCQNVQSSRLSLKFPLLDLSVLPNQQNFEKKFLLEGGSGQI